MHKTDRLTVVAVVVVHVRIARIEVEVVGVVRIVGRRRPIVTVRLDVVHIRSVAVARRDKTIASATFLIQHTKKGLRIEKTIG